MALALNAIQYKFATMSLYHFKKLNQEKQFTNLLLYGVCVAMRNTDEHNILLFQLENFYVEIFLDIDYSKILCYRSFQDTDELYPYLEQIDISNVT